MTLPLHPNIVRHADPYETGKLICLVVFLACVIVGGMLIVRMI